MNKTVTILILALAITSVMSAQAYGQSIPPQMKVIAKMWVDGLISDSDYIKALQSLVDSGILKGQKSLSGSGTVSKEQIVTKQDAGKLFLLLPQKADLGPEWKIIKSLDYNKATKSFYYDNAGQISYEKNVNTIKDYRMHVFQFSDSKSAEKAYEKKYDSLKRSIGRSVWNEDYTKSEFKPWNPDRQIMDSQNCIAVKLDSDLGDYDHMFGYCLVKNYIIYEDITGYYPDMKSDFIRMMDVAKSKIR